MRLDGPHPALAAGRPLASFCAAGVATRSTARLVALAAAILSALPAAALDLDVETFCTADRLCRLKVTFGSGASEEIVVTAFRANRVGPDMRYFPAEHYGRTDFAGAGLFHLDRQVVVDEAGRLVDPQAEDAPEDLLTLTMTVGLDPEGHATFFTGVVHASGNSIAQQAYVWGYPPTTVKNIGSVGGPRSPVAPRRLPPPGRQRQGTGLTFHLWCSPENRCSVQVLMATENRLVPAVTDFRANVVGEDMRYYPSEKGGGADLIIDGCVYDVELDLVTGPKGGLRPAKPDDPPDRVETMTAAIALDSNGHVTFFYAFQRDPDSNYVRRFLLWGYAPGTLMVDGPEDDPDPAELDPRKT
jgi:hypothetical protein